MAGNSGTINIKLQLDDNGSVKVLNQVGDTAEKTGKRGKKSFEGMESSSKKMTGGIKGSTAALVKMGSAVVGVLAVKAAIEKLTAFTMEAINAASDLQETTSKFDTVFEGQEASANSWSKTLVDSYFMSTRESKLFLSSVQDLLVPMGMGAEAAGKMSFEASKLAADLGSFNNLQTAQVMEDIQSALVGEYEPMKKYGVVLNAAKVEQQALNMGLADTKDALIAADKAQAAYELIVQSSSTAIGDMGRTSDGYANQVKKMNAQIEDLKANLGDGLLPVATLVVQEINYLIGSTEVSEKSMKSLANNGVLFLADAFQVTLETMRFFHNGWLGIKLVGELAIQAIAVSLDELQLMLRQVMLPLDAIFKGMVKLGAIDVNPFDALSHHTQLFRKSSADVTASVLNDIQSVNAKYDSVKGTIDGLKKKIREIPVEQEKADKEIVKSGQATQKTIRQETDKTAKANKKQLEEFDQLFERYQKEEVKITEKSLKQQAQAYEQSGADKKQVAEWLNHELQKLYDADAKDAKKAEEKKATDAKKAAADRAGAYREMYQDLGQSSDDYYDREEELLEKQRDDYETLTGDKALADAWYTSQHKELLKEQILDSDNFFEGVKIGLDDTKADMMTWAEAGKEITQSMTTTMAGAFSDTLYAGIKGDISSISDIWQSAMDSMLQKLIDTVAQMIVEWAVVKTMEAAAGVISWAGYEDGNWDVGAAIPDVHGNPGTPVVVHDGEMIVPATISDRLRDALGRNGVSDFDGMSAALSGGAFDAESPFGVGLAGFGQSLGMTAAKNTAIAGTLSSQGVSVGVSDIVGATLSPGSLSTAAVSGFNAAVASMLGINTSKWGTIGTTTAAGLGASQLGPLGGLLGTLGGVAGMGIGDMTNTRSMEAVRDMFESKLGFFDGLQAFSDFVDGMESGGFATEGMTGWGGFKGLGIGNPGSYGGSNGFGSDYSGGGRGDGTGNGSDRDGGGDSVGGAHGDRGMGGRMGGYAKGGYIDSLFVPAGEDGFAAVQYGEGVISRKGMDNLAQLNLGNIKSPPQAMAPIVFPDDFFSPLEKKFDDLQKSVNTLVLKVKQWDREGLPATRRAA
ncbi:MAG: hypothetical protein JEZ12_24080 [Desulfobacterium sp.]|nr:hypothetical protein [Desulfobacterium sp.]